MSWSDQEAGTPDAPPEEAPAAPAEATTEQETPTPAPETPATETQTQGPLAELKAAFLRAEAYGGTHAREFADKLHTLLQGTQEPDGWDTGPHPDDVWSDEQVQAEKERQAQAEQADMPATAEPAGGADAGQTTSAGVEVQVLPAADNGGTA